MEFDYFLETGLNSTLYWGRLNSVFVKSSFLEKEQINYGVEIRTLNNCIVKGIYPIVEIIPIDRPVCSIQIFYKNELKLTQHFIVIDIPGPLLTSETLRDWRDERTTNYDEIIPSVLTLESFLKISKIGVHTILDSAGNSRVSFQLVQFKFSILREKEVVLETVNHGELFNENIEEFKKQVQLGDRLLFENVTCHLSECGNERPINKKFNYNIVTIS